MLQIFLRELNVIGWDFLLACCGAWNVSYGSPEVPDKLNLTCEGGSAACLTYGDGGRGGAFSRGEGPDVALAEGNPWVIEG